MKLLVFRVKDVTLFQGYPPDNEDCNSTAALPSLRDQVYAPHPHCMASRMFPLKKRQHCRYPANIPFFGIRMHICRD